MDKKKKKVDKLKAEELEKRTAPFAGMPDAVPDHAHGHDISTSPGPRGGPGPKEFEVLDGNQLSSQPTNRPPAPQEGDQVHREVETLDGDN